MAVGTAQCDSCTAGHSAHVHSGCADRQRGHHQRARLWIAVDGVDDFSRGAADRARTAGGIRVQVNRDCITRDSNVHAGAYLVDAATGEIIWKLNREDDPRWRHAHTGWAARDAGSSGSCL